jgi:hypothetical protein
VPRVASQACHSWPSSLSQRPTRRRHRPPTAVPPKPARGRPKPAQGSPVQATRDLSQSWSARSTRRSFGASGATSRRGTWWTIWPTLGWTSSICACASASATTTARWMLNLIREVLAYGFDGIGINLHKGGDHRHPRWMDGVFYAHYDPPIVDAFRKETRRDPARIRHSVGRHGRNQRLPKSRRPRKFAQPATNSANHCVRWAKRRCRPIGIRVRSQALVGRRWSLAHPNCAIRIPWAVALSE